MPGTDGSGEIDAQISDSSIGRVRFGGLPLRGHLDHSLPVSSLPVSSMLASTLDSTLESVAESVL